MLNLSKIKIRRGYKTINTVIRIIMFTSKYNIFIYEAIYEMSLLIDIASFLLMTSLYFKAQNDAPRRAKFA